MVGVLVRSYPAQLSILVFLAVAVLFTGLLSLPVSARAGVDTHVSDAAFTAVSALTVTGLASVNTAEHWSFLGQVFILAAIQIGGLGIITIAILLTRAVTRSLGVRGKLFARQGGVGTDNLGDVRRLLVVVVSTSLLLEAALAVILVPAFIVTERSVPGGIWHGVFYAVSSFNNAGFTTHADGMAGFDGNLFIVLPVMAGVFVGSFGFPVFTVLLVAKWHPKHWNLHTKLTLLTTTVLFLAGALVWGALEWSNAATIGDMPVGERILNSAFASVMTRSGGFSLVDTADTTSATQLITDALMFVGGGSASTAGGIKVTTLAVMFLAILAEARGDKKILVFGRTLPDGAIRVAISVTFLGATLVLAASILLLLVSDAPLNDVVFEVISAFATCGLSIGLSEQLPPAGKIILAVVMLMGRIGPIGLASALAIRRRNLLYSYPTERPILG